MRTMKGPEDLFGYRFFESRCGVVSFDEVPCVDEELVAFCRVDTVAAEGVEAATCCPSVADGRSGLLCLGSFCMSSSLDRFLPSFGYDSLLRSSI